MEYSRQRRFPRLPESHGLLVKSRGPVRYEGLHRTNDLSLGGCGFLCRSPLGLGARLTLLLSVERRVLNVAARVVREKNLGDGDFDVGVEFTAMGKAERMMLESLFALEGLECATDNRSLAKARHAVA